MRRRSIILLLLSIAIGLFATVAIAWSDAAYAQSKIISQFGDEPSFGVHSKSWAGESASWYQSPVLPYDIAQRGLRDLQQTGKLPLWWGRQIAIKQNEPWGDAQVIQSAHGWPMPALMWESEESCVNDPRQPNTRLSGGIRIRGEPGSRSGVLPLIPIPLGILLNTLLFSLPWLALFLGLPALRRRLRARRGQCPTCRYDFRGLPPDAPCPECGNLSEP